MGSLDQGFFKENTKKITTSLKVSTCMGIQFELLNRIALTFTR